VKGGNKGVAAKQLELLYVASLSALAIVLKFRFFEIPYPPAPFLKYDVSGIPLALIAFISVKNTVPALAVYYMVHVLIGADPIGMAMKCLAEASTFIPLTTLYKLKSSRALAAASAVIARTLIMVVANYLITPYWLILARWASTFEDAYTKTLAYLPHVALFNATLALVVAPLTLITYGILKKARYLA